MHWSLDWSRPEQPEFENELRAGLESYLASRTNSTTVESAKPITHFTILPNFWRGYHAPAAPLRIGRLTVSLVYRDGKRYLEALQTHETSGETLRATYPVNDDHLLSIAGPWEVQVTNASGDTYASWSAEGKILPDRTAVVLTRGHRLELGAIPENLPATTTYALHLAMGTLAASNEPCFAVLEEFQRLCAPIRLRSVGTLESDVLGQVSGWWLAGTGAPPSYWWLDSSDEIIAVSTTFSTYVRSAGGAA